MLQLCNDYKQALMQLPSLPKEQLCWENSFGLIDTREAELNSLFTLSFTLTAPANPMHTDPHAAEAMMPLMMAKALPFLDEAIWSTLKCASQQAWVQELSPEKQHFIKRYMLQGITQGADLSAADKLQYTQLSDQLRSLCQRYQINIMMASNTASVQFADVRQLEGMSELWLARAAQLGQQYAGGTEEKPIYYVGCNFSEVNELLKHCKVEASRKLVYKQVEAIGTQAPYDNTPLFEQILATRQAIAQLLGYESWADLRCASGMFGDAASAQAALQDIYDKSLPLWQRDSQLLLDTQAQLRGETQASAGDQLESWNILYLAEQAAQRHSGINEAELIPYLPAQSVISCMIQCYEQLFGVRIERIAEPVEIWKEGVECYRVRNSGDDKLLGYFYMDLYQTQQQDNGTMMRPLRCRVQEKGDPALAILFCSFPRAVDGQPSLLQWTDIPTLFHEFGHVMHLMCSETELHSSGSQHCAMDFIEMPSQLLENWPWERQLIKQFAKHHQRGESLPDELLDKLLESRYAKSIMDHYLTLQLGMSDLGIHKLECKQFAGEGATQRIQALCPCPYPLSDMGEKPNLFLKQGQFIDNAYPGMLYTYSWGRVMAADLFARFKAEGLDNRALGQEYRRKILEKGASLPAAELYRDFMGRPPQSDAQLQQMQD